MPYLCDLEEDVHPEGGGARDGLGCRRPGGHHQPMPAQATPRARACTDCHGAGGSTTAVPSATTMAPGAAYNVVINLRHPMYASLLLLTWGAFLKDVSLAGFILSVAASTFLVVTAHVEERENMVRFGEAYSAYRRSTRRFIPFIY